MQIHSKITLKAAIFLALPAVCVLVGMPARAGTMSMAVMMDVKIHQSRSTFEPSSEHPGEDWFYLSKANDDVEVDMRLSMSGQKELVQRTRTMVSEVPGISDGISGYKRARIETFGNEATLIIDTKLVRKKQKEGKDIEERDESELRIPLQPKSKSATLEDLKAGRTVEYQMSKAGLKNLLQQTRGKAEAGMNTSAKGEGARVSVFSKAFLLDRHHRGLVFIGPNKIQYEPPPMRIRAQSRVRVGGGMLTP